MSSHESMNWKPLFFFSKIKIMINNQQRYRTNLGFQGEYLIKLHHFSSHADAWMPKHQRYFWKSPSQREQSAMKTERRRGINCYFHFWHVYLLFTLGCLSVTTISGDNTNSWKCKFLFSCRNVLSIEKPQFISLMKWKVWKGRWIG